MTLQTACKNENKYLPWRTAERIKENEHAQAHSSPPIMLDAYAAVCAGTLRINTRHVLMQ
jgi:hypothetical protein